MPTAPPMSPAPGDPGPGFGARPGPTPGPGGPAGRRVLGRAAGLAVVAYAFTVTMVGTTLPTPLYPLYRERFGFSQLMVTVVFATYAVGVITALLLFGRLSDQIGRRATLLPGLGASALAAVVFLTATGLPELLVGRLVSGLSAGIFTGTATAAIVDLAPPGKAARATLTATVANLGGLGCGPLLAGLVARFGPDPLRLTFAVDLALLVPAVLGVLLMPETVRPVQRGLAAGGRRRGPHVSRPRVPAEIRGVFVRASLAAFAGFAVLGLFTAVAPAFLGEVLHESSPLVIGLIVFGVFQASACGQIAAGRFGPGAGLTAGCCGLVLGMAGVGAALAASSLAVLVVGGLVAGFGQGLSFRAGLGALLGAAPPASRAEVSSAFFVVAYVAISLPVVGVGLLGQLTTLRTAGLVFAAGVALLGLVVLGLLRRARSEPAVTVSR